MDVQIVTLRPGDAGLLDRVCEGVFDGPVRPEWAADYLANPSFLLLVARHATEVVGMVSGIVYPHPDKAPQLFLNELGVADAHQNKGIGRRLVWAILQEARERGCLEAWVATEADNDPALRVYELTGFQRQPESVALFTMKL